LQGTEQVNFPLFWLFNNNRKLERLRDYNLNVSYSSPNYLWTVKSMSTRWKEHVSVMGMYENTGQEFGVETRRKGAWMGGYISGGSHSYRMR
jgi:hypothetical protein